MTRDTHVSALNQCVAQYGHTNPLDHHPQHATWQRHSRTLCLFMWRNSNTIRLINGDGQWKIISQHIFCTHSNKQFQSRYKWKLRNWAMSSNEACPHGDAMLSCGEHVMSVGWVAQIHVQLYLCWDTKCNNVVSMENAWKLLPSPSIKKARAQQYRSSISTASANADFARPHKLQLRHCVPDSMLPCRFR